MCASHYFCEDTPFQVSQSFSMPAEWMHLTFTMVDIRNNLSSKHSHTMTKFNSSSLVLCLRLIMLRPMKLLQPAICRDKNILHVKSILYYKFLSRRILQEIRQPRTCFHSTCLGAGTESSCAAVVLTVLLHTDTSWSCTTSEEILCQAEQAARLKKCLGSLLLGMALLTSS